MPSSASAILTQLTGVPLRIIVIIVVASLVTVVLRFLVARVIRRLARLPHQRVELSSNAKIVIGSAGPRTAQRFRTFQSVINSTIAVLVWSVAVIMVLAELGIAIGPLLASAGIVGVAVAFGAQSLVRDVISGLFMLIEDQFGVGDRIEIGATGAILCSGTVEHVELRVTTLRDDDGRIWHMRNGEILRVANHSQGWSLAIAQVQLAPGTDVAAAKAAMARVTDRLRAEDGYAEAILADAEVLVEEISAAAIQFRWAVRTTAGKEWEVASAMRAAILPELAGQGIDLAG
ncbi:MAG: mechanosensitive ion channel family protein [Beutenbergiaceae bacterium]